MQKKPKKEKAQLRFEPICKSLLLMFKLVATDLDKLHHKNLFIKDGVVMFVQFVTFNKDPCEIKNMLKRILRHKNPAGERNWLVCRKAHEFGCWGRNDHVPYGSYYFLDELFEDDEYIMTFVDMSDMTQKDKQRQQDREQEKVIRKLNQNVPVSLEFPDLMDIEESRRFIENVRFEGEPVRKKPEIEFD